MPLSWSRLIPASLALVAGGAVHAQVLTKAIEVRSLSVAEAQRGLEARLRGTVIFFEPTAAFVQDETSTTFFRPDTLDGLRLGDEIEVTGQTQPGLFLPGLGRSRYTILRHGTLAEPIPVSYDELVSARFHYQRVSVEGVVRALLPWEESRSLLRLGLGTRVLDVRIDAPLDRERAPVDSRVLVYGLAAGDINERRQLVRPYVRAQDWTEISILKPPTPVEQVPLVSAAELLAFQLTGRGEHRIRVAGVITAAFPNGPAYVRHDATAFEVRLAGAGSFKAGDRVELLGFPAMDRFSASVVDAEIVQTAPGPPPPPVDVAAVDDLSGKHDGDLVTVSAVVADTFKVEGGTALVLKGKTRNVQARLPEFVPEPPTGSLVRLSGICLVESGRVFATGFATRAGVVGLRARGPEDLVILRSPAWWTARRLATGLAVFAGITILAGLWIAVLRRQVRRQTEALRSRIESEAALEERHRIAREFHDTLEQELAGVSLRLDALATRELDEKGRQLIGASRNLVSRMQTETRDLISDLRDATETAGDLQAALAGVAARHSAESGAEVRLESMPTLPVLPAASVHDLRMIARESITNALNHGTATRVIITVAVNDGQLVMRIADNGRGFNAGAATDRRGHFGCAGIRERARKIGARVDWRSAPGAGTTVEVVMALARYASAPPALPAAKLPVSEERPATT